jgi:NarL family two-component system response regulator LiaR
LLVNFIALGGPVVTPIRVLIADDHAIVRQGLRVFLELEEDILIVDEAGDGISAVEKARKLLPDVVLMDLKMPRKDGVWATREIKKITSQIQIIVLSSFAETFKIRAALDAGAMGYYLKDVSPDDLASAIRAVQSGGMPLHPEVSRQLFKSEDKLTPREQEVLHLIGRGFANKEIAQELVLSEATVKTHVSHILDKLRLSDRTKAALYALREGFADLE